MNRIAYWEPMPYLRKDPVRLPPGEGCPPKFFRCTHCLKPANGHRTPFCPWCGYEMHELYEKEEKIMREILLRGQLRRKGEKVNMAGEPLPSIWKYGGAAQYGGGAVIYQSEPEIYKYPVYGDTVGQYTGLMDKNGVKIFEGDIVRIGRVNYPVIFNTLGGCAEFALKDDVPFGFDYINVPMEVIGNIYDNPELLEEESE